MAQIGNFDQDLDKDGWGHWVKQPKLQAHALSILVDSQINAIDCCPIFGNFGLVFNM